MSAQTEPLAADVAAEDIDGDESLMYLQTAERIDSGTFAASQQQQQQVPVAETIETNPFGRLGGQSVRMNVSRADADHFYATVILYPQGLGQNATNEVHAYMLPSRLLEPYRAQINSRIDEIGDYSAVAVVAPSCRSVGYMMISIKAPGQASPPMHEDNCFTKCPCLGCLLCCACCISCPLLCVGCCICGWVLRIAPCALQCVNCASSCCCPGTIIINASLARDIMRYMKEHGGERQFRVDEQLGNIAEAMAQQRATPAEAVISDGSHAAAPTATNVVPVSQTRASAMH